MPMNDANHKHPKALSNPKYPTTLLAKALPASTAASPKHSNTPLVPKHPQPATYFSFKATDYKSTAENSRTELERGTDDIRPTKKALVKARQRNQTRFKLFIDVNTSMTNNKTPLDKQLGVPALKANSLMSPPTTPSAQIGAPIYPMICTGLFTSPCVSNNTSTNTSASNSTAPSPTNTPK